jgi:hypothetical protein
MVLQQFVKKQHAHDSTVYSLHTKFSAVYSGGSKKILTKGKITKKKTEKLIYFFIFCSTKLRITAPHNTIC